MEKQYPIALQIIKHISEVTNTPMKLISEILHDQMSTVKCRKCLDSHRHYLFECWCCICNFNSRGKTHCLWCFKCVSSTLKHCHFCKKCVKRRFTHCHKCNKCVNSTFKHCDKCNECVDSTFKHCDKCEKCTDPTYTHRNQYNICVKNNLQYCCECDDYVKSEMTIHCEKCNKCVDKTYKHCDKCNKCVGSTYIHIDLHNRCIDRLKYCEQCDVYSNIISHCNICNICDYQHFHNGEYGIIYTSLYRTCFICKKYKFLHMKHCDKCNECVDANRRHNETTNKCEIVHGERVTREPTLLDLINAYMQNQ